MLLTCLPMLGDYFTSDMLSASPKTAMVGNLINDSVQAPGQTGQAGAFVMLVLLVRCCRCSTTCGSTGAAATRCAYDDARTPMPVTWWNDPWRPPRVLVGVTVGYLVWSLLPVLIAVAVLVQRRPSRTTWQGFSFRWYWGDPTAVGVARRDAAHRAVADAQTRV